MKKVLLVIMLFAFLIGILFANEKGAVLNKVKIDDEGKVTFLTEETVSNSYHQEDVNDQPIQRSYDSNQQNGNVQKSEFILPSINSDNNAALEYQTLLSMQESPLTTSEGELYNIHDTIWQRLYGECEYFLAPEIENITEYYTRISRHDNKDKGIQKSNIQFIKVGINNHSRAILHSVNVYVPSYVTNGNIINVLLPVIDAEYLQNSNCYVELLVNYGNRTGHIEEPPASREIIWSEGWEGSLAPYSRGDANPTDGLDYWGDVTNDHHSGSWSLWCADEGDQPVGVNYDDNMEAYVYKNDAINVSGYSNVHFKFWVNHDTESAPFDYLAWLYSTNGSSWTLSTQYSGNSNGWTQKSFTLNGWSNFYWKFIFHSDNTVHNYEGVYLDDMEVTGDGANPLPNLTYDPSNCNLQVNSNIVSAEVRVINNGTASAGSSYLGYYLSTNTTITTTDYLWGDDYVGSLSAGSYSNENMNFDVNVPPTGCPPGTYYFGIIVDYQDQVTESDETDNDGYWPTPQIIIPANQPNLTVNTSFCNLYVNSNIVSAEVRVINNGSASAGSSYLGYYLSTDTTISTNDYFWGEDYVSTLSAGSYSNENQNFDVNVPPTGCSPGTYYFGIIVDYQDQVTESDESDNDWFWSTPMVTIPVPFFLTISPETHSSPYQGDSFSISISSNVTWNVSDNATWIGCNPTYGYSNGSTTVTVSANTGAARSGTVTVTGSGITRTCTINQAAAPYLTISPTTHSSPFGGDTFNITVTSNISWVVSDNATWISTSGASGSGNDTFQVNVSANTGAARSGTVTVTGSGITRTCTINQAVAPYLTISPTTHSSPFGGDTFTISITSNVSWTVTDNQTWISCNPTTGSNNGSTTVTVSANTGAARSGTVTVTGGGITQTCIITQLVVPPMPPTDPVPMSGAVDILIDTDLNWINGTNIETIDLYFGTYDPPTTLVLDNVPAVETYDPGNLDYETIYYWKVICRNISGEASGDIWNFTTIPEVSVTELMPEITELQCNHPNPFNPETTISYSMNENSRVLIEIYNIKGQKIKTLINGFREVGYHSVIWNGKDDSGKLVTSGLYFYRMKTSNYDMMRKMILLK